MIKKKEIRNWLKGFFIQPQKKTEKKIWLWDKAIYGLMLSFLALASKDTFPLLVLTGVICLWIIYNFFATGR